MYDRSSRFYFFKCKSTFSQGCCSLAAFPMLPMHPAAKICMEIVLINYLISPLATCPPYIYQYYLVRLCLRNSYSDSLLSYLRILTSIPHHCDAEPNGLFHRSGSGLIHSGPTSFAKLNLPISCISFIYITNNKAIRWKSTSQS